MAPKVLIADKLSPAALAIFKSRGVQADVQTGLSKAELLQIIGQYDGLAVRSATKADADVIAAAKSLKVIGRAGIGVDNVDIPAATKAGIVVMNTPFGNAITTAEHAIALIFALARQLPEADQSTQAGKWEKNRFMGVELTAKTLGLIGCGNIGSIVADRANGLRMKVVAYDPFLTAERAGQKLEFPANKVLVAVGRRPYTDNLGLEQAGVQLDEKKRVKVDAHLKTTAPGVWAIGDVIAGPMLAHKAEEDGYAVAEWIAGKAGHINWDLVPAIVYTEPEVASVGLGEDAAKAANRAINVGKFNFAANGRAIAQDATDGFVKIIADAKTDKILGAQIIGHGAGELISEVVTHMEYGGSAEDLARTIHAHPTMSEAVKEAGLAVSKSAIHAL